MQVKFICAEASDISLVALKPSKLPCESLYEVPDRKVSSGSSCEPLIVQGSDLLTLPGNLPSLPVYTVQVSPQDPPALLDKVMILVF